ncbi:hypothetical protein [Micromonospora carbonacea]|uniref:Uncharacterized protein n=1 Tax=Micromonospora carbonacea TaxID=47853 RepID=A0A1C4ZKL8_9ACTN|nr:hypothetical protein [Micromonospora carbonacea]SCF33553.1 hypothetical protein GA0070563_108307 [Micromonospora carbonacea]
MSRPSLSRRPLPAALGGPTGSAPASVNADTGHDGGGNLLWAVTTA